MAALALVLAIGSARGQSGETFERIPRRLMEGRGGRKAFRARLSIWPLRG